LIHRFYEDPLQLLSSIKDDDRLAAYKITKMDKNTKYLQLIHRRRDSDSQTISGWKPYGTPIVSLISCDDTITRGDIQVIVNRILSPLLLKGGNAAASAETNVVSNSINKDNTVSKVPTLPLLLVDDNNACIDLSMGEDKVVKLSPSSAKVLVYIDWSQKLLEKYDTHPLETLPEVLKYGPVTKKARTEPLSLYTCLEAFLREEPLVPEDMWLVCPLSSIAYMPLFSCLFLMLSKHSNGLVINNCLLDLLMTSKLF
jgi:ubiquitin carboxyl-terminal hydrolase 4/11/15